jgi:PAS domain S-box-containing protein
MKIASRYNEHQERIRIVAIYALLGSLWICLSDSVVGWLIHDPAAITRFSVYKGILFVVLTSGLLYFLLARYLLRMAEYNRQLVKSEDRFISIFNNMSDAIFIHDAGTGAIVDANESVSRMFGYDREEMLRLRVGDISQGEPPYSQVEALQWLGRAVDSASPVMFEWCCRDKEGNLFWAECTMRKAPVGDEECIIVAVRDISERKLMETSLRESEQQYRTLTENSPDIIMRYDRECRRIYVNPSYTRATGIFLDKDKFGTLGQKWPAGMSMSVKEYKSKLRRVMETGVSAEILLEWPCQDTEQVVSHVFNVVAETDSAGAITGCLAIGHNITGRKKVEFRLARMAESLPGIMFTFLLRLDGSSCMPYVSARVEEYGLRPEDMAEDMFQAFALIHPDDRACVRESIARSAQTLSHWHTEFRVRHPTKGDVWVEGQAMPESQQRGDILWSGFLYDITERKAAEASLDAKQKQLASMAVDLSLAEERERRRIASELHDHIGQMLLLSRIKLGSLGALFHGGGDEDTYRDIQELLAQTITDVRSLTQQLNPPLLSSVGLEAALEWLAKRMEADYSLLVNFSDDGSAKPLCEEFRAVLFQSARELLINVSKYAGTNEAWLTIGREADRLRLVVQDNGVGFLCHPHNEMHGFRNNSYGLFNIRQRIEYLGGKLVIESAPGCGTRVTIHVPLTIDGVGGSVSAPYLIESGAHAITEGR